MSDRSTKSGSRTSTRKVVFPLTRARVKRARALAERLARGLGPIHLGKHNGETNGEQKDGKKKNRKKIYIFFKKYIFYIPRFFFKKNICIYIYLKKTFFLKKNIFYIYCVCFFQKNNNKYHLVQAPSSIIAPLCFGWHVPFWLTLSVTL